MAHLRRHMIMALNGELGPRIREVLMKFATAFEQEKAKTEK
jgi:hypothetical protein